MGGLIVKAKSTPPNAKASHESGPKAPRPRQTRWWAYGAGVLCLALAWPLYQYNVSHWRKQGALSFLEAGDPAAAIRLLEVEQKAAPRDAEIAYWLAVSHRRAGHVSIFQDHLLRAKELGYSEDELYRQHLLMQIQSGAVNPELERQADGLVQDAENYSGPRVDLYIDEFYEARARGYLANYRLFDAEVTLDHWVQARPNSIPARLMRADIRAREVNFRAAEREYREVLALSPGNLEARLRRALMLMHDHQIQEAIQEYRICLQAAPQEVRAQMGLAECEYRSGDGIEAARERLKKLLEQKLSVKERAEALFLLGEIARGQKESKLAIKYLTEALQLLSPLDPAPYLTLSTAYSSLGQRAEAAKYLKISQEKLARFNRVHDLVVKVAQSPQNAQLRFEQGNLYAEEGQMEEAAAWWNMAARFDPQLQAAHEKLAEYYVSKGDSERAEHHRGLAEQSTVATYNSLWLDLLDSNTKSVREGLPKLAGYASLREPVELLTLGLNVVERKDLARSAQGLGRLTNNPKLRMRALTMLGEALYVMGDYHAAERAYLEVLATSPRNVVAHRGLQLIYYDLGDYDRMETHALEVAKIDQSDYRPHRLLGFLRRDTESWETAIVEYKESLRRSPHQPTREEVLLEMADCYVQLRKYPEALDMLIDARPSAQKTYLEAQCKYATKHVPAAKKLLDESLQTSPDHVQSLLLRSDIALTEDDAPAARGFLERAVEAAPYDNNAHQKLSTVLLRLGEKEGARKEADRAKELLDLHLRFSELNSEASQRPKDIAVRKELAAIARQLGREEEAKRWERVVAGMTADPAPTVKGPAVPLKPLEFDPSNPLPAVGKPGSPIGPQPVPKAKGR
ncbi:MAG: tetratricopeptide repeat protein [Pirellulaceae bacterium]|nr:tetratricopeptide repeat protein [Pirellulaceae bacterium]